jgi:hypothetical protein
MLDKHEDLDVERKTVTLPIDANLQAAVADLEKDGWGPIPGIPPTATYHLIRPKPSLRRQVPEPPSSGAIGKLLIHDDLIAVIGPDGKRKG